MGVEARNQFECSREWVVLESGHKWADFLTQSTWTWNVCVRCVCDTTPLYWILVLVIGDSKWGIYSKVLCVLLLCLTPAGILLRPWFWEGFPWWLMGIWHLSIFMVLPVVFYLVSALDGGEGNKDPSINSLVFFWEAPRFCFVGWQRMTTPWNLQSKPWYFWRHLSW